MDSHPYTCNTCQVAFRASDAQRTHMRSDWHRYNLKRRVATLPPISSEVFTDKVLNAQASTSAAAAKATFEKSCVACQKTYYSENAFQNHIGSQKHKQRETQLRKAEGKDDSASVISGTFSMGEPIDEREAGEAQDDAEPGEQEFSDIINGIKGTSIESRDPLPIRPRRPSHNAEDEMEKAGNGEKEENSKEEEVNVPLTQCFFCNYNSPNIKLNVLHMGKFHGMFVPEQGYLVDGEGLLEYLQAKIYKNSECLYCHKLKSTPEAIQTHMKDKGHCMIAFETEDEQIEIGQFYDFTSTYSDDEEEDGEAVDVEGDGWETDTSVSSLDSAEIGAEPIDDRSHRYSKLSKHAHHSNTDARRHRNADGFHSHAHVHTHAAFVHDGELHLPTGRTAGHRSMAKYFRQNLHNYPTPEERLTRQRMIEEAGSDATDGADGQGDDANKNRALMSRANGGMGMIGASESQKKEVRAAELRERKRAERSQRLYEWRVNKGGNSQKHFRDPLLQ